MKAPSKNLYAVVTDNTRYSYFESTRKENNYQDTKYRLIIKRMMKDQTEQIETIIYSDDILELTAKAKKYISWFNYIIGLAKLQSGQYWEI